MNNRILKPHTPCFLVNSKYQENMGRVVEVIRYLETHPKFGEMYRCKSISPIVVEVHSHETGKPIPNSSHTAYEFQCRRSQLKPIIPPELDEQTQKHVENTINQGT